MVSGWAVKSRLECRSLFVSTGKSLCCLIHFCPVCANRSLQLALVPMQVHSTASRNSKIFSILLLLLVVAAISAQTFHLHSSTEPPTARHCTLCEVAPGILPVLTVNIPTAARLVHPVEVAELQASLQFCGASNLSVRPPPSSLS